MWLKNCEDNVKETRCDALYGRRIRPLFPKPNASMNNSSASCFLTPSNYSGDIGNSIGFPMNFHQSCVHHNEASKDENHMMEPLVSSRWNPTPEQLMALEEMYRRGVRTPSAEEIKLIAAKLRQFGKIEGKNVFYWFQNHKARERQKRRRQPDSNSSKNVANDIETLDAKQTGFSCKAFEAEQIKKLIPTIPTNSSTSKESESVQRSMVTESGSDGWTHLDERELQRKIAKGAKSSLMDLSCVASNSKAALSTFAAPAQNDQDNPFTALEFCIVSPSCSEDMIKYEDGNKDYHTLELFPLRSGDQYCSIGASEAEIEELMMTTIDSNLAPKQFYEFL